MKLNVYVLSEYLPLNVLRVFSKSSFSEGLIDSIGFYSPEVPNPSWQITIVEKSNLSEAILGGGTLICGMIELSALPPDDCSVILVDERYSIQEIYNGLLHVFRRFQELEQRLFTLVAEHADFHEFGDAILPFINNPVALYTVSHQNVFYAEAGKEEKYRQFLDITENEYLNFEDIQTLKFNADFIGTLDTVEPSIFPADVWGYRELYYNIRIEGIYIARSLVFEVERPLRSSDWLLIKEWSRFLQYKIRDISGLEAQTHPMGFDALIYALLEGNAIDKQECDRILESYGWDISNDYFCVLFSPNHYDLQSGTLTAICANLEMHFQGSAALRYDGRILLIVNLCKSVDSMEQSISRFSTILREGVLKAGTSKKFQNLLSLQQYYHQAKDALLIGSTIDLTYWHFPYSRYSLPISLSHIVQEQTLLSLCPDGLLKLIQYDIRHNRTFTESLRVYLLNNCSMAKSVKVLYIQKSTFVYQLQRIRDITRMDLDNFDQRLELMIYFRILEYAGIKLADLKIISDLDSPVYNFSNFFT